MVEPKRARDQRTRIVKGNFAIYLGKMRTFPNGKRNILVEPGIVYEIAIYPPGYGYTFYQVRVRTNVNDVYLPYCSTADIWNEWMPYGGEIDD